MLKLPVVALAASSISASKFSLSIIDGPLITNDLNLGFPDSTTLRGKLDSSCTNLTDIPILKNDRHHCPNTEISFYIALQSSSLTSNVPVLKLSENMYKTIKANTGKYLLVQKTVEATALFDNSSDTSSATTPKPSPVTGEKDISATAIVALAIVGVVFIFGLCYYYCYRF